MFDGNVVQMMTKCSRRGLNKASTQPWSLTAGGNSSESSSSSPPFGAITSSRAQLALDVWRVIGDDEGQFILFYTIFCSYISLYFQSLMQLLWTLRLSPIGTSGWVRRHSLSRTRICHAVWWPSSASPVDKNNSRCHSIWEALLEGTQKTIHNRYMMRFMWVLLVLFQVS